MYRPHSEQQRKEIERIQREENMSLPQDIDYLSLPVSLSQEVREILDRVRPSTVSPHVQNQYLLCCYIKEQNQYATNIVPIMYHVSCMYHAARSCYTFARYHSSCSRPSSQLCAPHGTKGETTAQISNRPKGGREAACKKHIFTSVK